MVVHVDFGFNVGAEYGGFHWAVVIQNDNKAAHTIVVVPLSSLKKRTENT
ncbi:type II toxin-antitoxin system PemK/MazF family toxin [Bacillus paranthracis]